MADGFSQPHVVHDEPCPEPGDDRRGTLVDSPYDAGFVRDVKARWKHGARYWSPETECWWIEAGHEQEVEDLVVEHYGGARIVDADGAEMVRDKSGDYSQGGFWP